MLVNTIAPLVLIAALCSTQQVDFGNTYVNFPYEIPDEELTSHFDWQLLKELAPYNKNLLLSPISLKLILALLYQGSSSIAERELQSTLNFQSKDDNRKKFSDLLSTLLDNEKNGNVLNIGSSMFIDDHLHVFPKFNQTAWQSFRTNVEPVCFDKPEEASKTINEWVHMLTKGKVSKIVSADDLQETIMLLTNIIYFKGIWKHPFPQSNSYTGRFLTLADYEEVMGTPKFVEYMKTTSKFLYYQDRNLDAKIVKLDYKGDSHSMYIILPNSLGGMDSLIKKIGLTSISQIKFSLREELVELTIPKINFKFATKFGNILKKLGLKQLFQNTNSLTGIVQGDNTIRRQLVVSNIIQKTGIQVDEKGTEAYAVTNINIGNKMGENIIIFNATHPFLFFIEGPKNTVLFVGKYEDPNESEGAELGNRWSINEGADDATSQVYPAPPQFNTQRVSNNQGHLPTNRFNDVQINQQSPVFDSSISSNMDDSYEPPNAEDIAYRFNLFDVELLSTFSDSKTNVLISPASIKTTLAMILEGAGGKCASEIEEALRIKSLNQRGVRDILLNLLSNLNEKATTNTYLESHNGIFASNKHRLVEAYRNTVMRYYNANVRSLDFSNPEAAANEINQWASEATHGVIKEVISSQMINPETYVIISNALYFKGKWKKRFDQRVTNPNKCFRTANGCVPVQMMHISDTFYNNYISRISSYVVDIPYQDKFSMLLILPTIESSVRAVLRDFATHRLSDILAMLNNSEIVLEMPKFSFEYTVDLAARLKQEPLNVREVFGANANLSGIVQNSNAMVNSMVHKTKIEVDEQGTVAAASTNAMIIPLMQPVTITADRPFIFLIYHQDTKNIIFEGIVQNPVQQQPASAAGNQQFSMNQQAPLNRRTLAKHYNLQTRFNQNFSELIEPELRLIFLNTLYFKGKWKTVFQNVETKCFQTASNNCIPTEMMSVTQTFNVSYVNSLQAQFVEIPYQENYSMLVGIPTAETDVKQLLRNLPFYSLDKIIDGLNETKINLEIPKFTLEYSVDLVKYLSRNSIGIKEIFGTNANLSGIIHGNVSVNNLLHKTRMEVDEQGSVAAASTSAAIVPFALPVQVKANRPFVFIIFDRETKNVIFEGIVQNPAKQGSSGNTSEANPPSSAREAYSPTIQTSSSKREPDYAVNTSPSNRQDVNINGVKTQRLTPVRGAIGPRFAFNYNYESNYFYTYKGAKLVH